jgi:hypothetical protein
MLPFFLPFNRTPCLEKFVGGFRVDCFVAVVVVVVVVVLYLFGFGKARARTWILPILAGFFFGLLVCFFGFIFPC